MWKVWLWFRSKKTDSEAEWGWDVDIMVKPCQFKIHGTNVYRMEVGFLVANIFLQL